MIPARIFSFMGIFLKKFFITKGRSSRSELFYFILFCIALLTLFIKLDMSAIHILVTLLVLTPSFSVILIRRLHDSNCRGWWALLLPVFIVSGWFFFVLASQVELAVWLLLIPAMVLAILAYFLLRKSTAGPNRFGDEPR